MSDNDIARFAFVFFVCCLSLVSLFLGFDYLRQARKGKEEAIALFFTTVLLLGIAAAVL